MQNLHLCFCSSFFSFSSSSRLQQRQLVLPDRLMDHLHRFRLQLRLDSTLLILLLYFQFILALLRHLIHLLVRYKTNPG
jgi:hypothetical protein